MKSQALPKASSSCPPAIALATGFAMPQAASANDDDTVSCSLRTLRGVYEFSASGFNIVNGVALPKAIIETVVFDGHGNVSRQPYRSPSTAIFIQPPQGNPGVYTVNANCTGTLTFADGPMFDLHVAPYGKSIKMLQTNPNTVMQGTALKVLPLSAWGG